MGPPKFYTRDGLTRNRFQHSCLMRMRIKHKNRLPFCFRDTFARISRQMVCFSIKLEQQSSLA